MGELSNSVLLREALQGDRDAWATLVNRHSGLIWSIARRHSLNDAQGADIMQITALRLIERGHQVRDPEKLSQWIAAVARNECRRMLRVREIAVPDRLNQEEPEENGVDHGLITAELRQTVTDALADLPPRCRELLTLLFVSDQPNYEELSRQLGIPIGSIGPTRGRCLDRLARHPLIRGIREQETDS